MAKFGQILSHRRPGQIGPKTKHETPFALIRFVVRRRRRRRLFKKALQNIF